LPSIGGELAGRAGPPQLLAIIAAHVPTKMTTTARARRFMRHS
jgi:hypothetical protein